MQRRVETIRLSLVKTKLARASSGTVVGPLNVNSLGVSSIRVANDAEQTQTAGPREQAYWRLRINGINYRIALRSDILAPVPFVIRVGPMVSTFSLPLIPTGKYRFAVQWGDGNSDTITAHDQPERLHTYSVAGEYTVTITGTLVGWKFGEPGVMNPDASKVLDIQQWGSDFIMGIDEGQYFWGCSNMIVSATDVPNLSYTYNMASAFRDCHHFNPSSAPDWDMSNVRSMAYMLTNALAFNQPIGTWDTSNVTSMSGLFLKFIQGVMLFNQNINDWDVSKVTSFFQMFEGCINFDQPLDQWDTSSCTTFYSMFRGTPFNHPIGNWNTSKVTNVEYMFRDASAFNQYIGDWDMSQVTSALQMFYTDSSNSFNNGELGYDIIEEVTPASASYTSNTRTLVCANLANYVQVGDVLVINATVSNQLRVISAVVESRAVPDTVVFKASPAPNVLVDLTAFLVTRISKQLAGTKPLAWTTPLLTNIAEMFSNNVYFNQDISSWSTASVTNANSAFRSTSNLRVNLFNNGQLIDGTTQPMTWTFPAGANLSNFRQNCRLTDANKPTQVT